MLLPTLLGELRSVPVETIGFMLMPRGIGFVLGTFVLGRLIKVVDPRMMLALGFLIEAVAFWYLTTFDLTIGLFEVFRRRRRSRYRRSGHVDVPVATITFSTLAPTSPGLRIGDIPIWPIFRERHGHLSGRHRSLTLDPEQSRDTERIHFSLSAKRFAPRNTLPSGIFRVPRDCARLDGELTRQAAMIGYINDFWLLMVLTLAVMPLILFLDRPGNSE